MTLAYHLNDDREIFFQKVTQIDRLKLTIDRCVKDGLEKLHEEVEHI